MSQPFLGEIRPVPYNFAPQGWAFCDGQLLSIAQNTALFALIGTTFGGDGQTTFALPDLRSRIPVGAGQGPGLENYDLGEVAGTEAVALTTGQMPVHSHSVNVSTSPATTVTPTGNLPAVTPRKIYGAMTADNFAGDAVSVQGSNQVHGNIQPYLSISYIIALQGIFPSH